MILTYEAVDRQGKHQSDTVEASDAKEAIAQLRSRGLYVSQISEARSRGGRAKAEAITATARRAGRLPLRPLVLFTRQMAMLLRAGSGIVPALRAIRREVKKPEQAALMEHLITDLEEGMPLTDALRRHPRTFNPVYCAVVAAGEASASLTEMFERMAVIVGKRQAMRGKILGALAYPALLIWLCLGIINTLVFFVLPRFADMFKQLGVELPASTRLMLAAGQGAVEYWPALVLALGAFVGTLIFLARDPRGRQWFNDAQLRIPVIGRLLRRLLEAQVLRTMGMLLESKVGVLDTIDLARGVSNNVEFRKLFSALDNAVTSGGQLSTAFETFRHH